MSEAFEDFLKDDKNVLSIKLLKLRLLGLYINAEYKDGEDYKTIPPNTMKDIAETKKYISSLNGLDDESVESIQGAESLVLLINFINKFKHLLHDDDDAIKNNININININLTKNSTDKTEQYIYVLKSYMNELERLLKELFKKPIFPTLKYETKTTTSGEGYETDTHTRTVEDIKVFLAPKNNSGFGSSVRKYVFLKRYISHCQKYNEVLLYYISTKVINIPLELLRLRDELTKKQKECEKETYKLNCFIEQFRILYEYSKMVQPVYYIATGNTSSSTVPSAGASSAGGAPIKYKYVPTGDVAYILYNKKRIKRNIYVKVKGRPTKYCKINKEYVLLSKLR